MDFLYQKLPLTCFLHQPLMALIFQPHCLCRVTRTLKVQKWQSKGGILFVCCIISCSRMLSLYDYMFALSYRQRIYAFYLCVAVVYFCELLYSILLFSHFSLSLLTQLRALAAHGCDAILLALARCLWGSAWAPALARCTRVRFFCLLLNHVRPHSFPRPDSLKPPLKTSLSFSFLLPNILTPHSKNRFLFSHAYHPKTIYFIFIVQPSNLFPW